MLDEIQKVIPEEAKERIADKLAYFVVVAFNGGMAFLSDNSSGIEALCTVVATALLVTKFWLDRKEK